MCDKYVEIISMGITYLVHYASDHITVSLHSGHRMHARRNFLSCLQPFFGSLFLLESRLYLVKMLAGSNAISYLGSIALLLRRPDLVSSN